MSVDFFRGKQLDLPAPTVDLVELINAPGLPLLSNSVSLIRSVDKFHPDITIEEQHAHQLVVTDHPVQGAQDGNFSISDHAYRLPAEVVITYGWSPSGNGRTLSSGRSSNFLNELYQKILDLQESRQLFTVYTGRKIYKNMILLAVAMSTDVYTENALIVRMVCREVIFAQTTKLSVLLDPKTQLDPAKTLSALQRGGQTLQAGDAANKLALLPVIAPVFPKGE